jgi:glycosyltransferase involved in cell wall biosynthesis
MARAMNILVVSHPCVVDTNQHIYRELARLGERVTLVTPNRWRHEYQPSCFEPRLLPGLGGRLVALPVVRPGSITLHAYRARLTAALRDHAPDIEYIEEEPYSIPAFQWSLAAANCGVPAVFYTAQNIAKRYPLPFRMLERSVWRRTSGAVCVSHGAAEALRARGYAGGTHIVPLSVDETVFRPRPRDPALAKQLGLRDRVIGFLGLLSPAKGVTVLLDAYRYLPVSVRESTSLLFLGAGQLAPQCRAESGAVVKALRHSEVAEYLPLLDVLALPSLTTPREKEQFGRAAIEAMACGVPVVGSDSGEIPQVLRQGGGGIIVPEDDARALAHALLDILQDEDARRRLGGQGRVGTVAAFSTRQAAVQLQEALRRALA